MVKILFGTESGNSEMAADDIAQILRDEGFNAEVVPMDEADVASLADQDFAIIITSTYGEGELPETTQPFYDALQQVHPDLCNLHFAAFGLGDSSYETYGNGIDTVAALLKELGATQISTTGRHDAAKSELLPEVCTAWARAIIPLAAGSLNLAA